MAQRPETDDDLAAELMADEEGKPPLYELRFDRQGNLIEEISPEIRPKGKPRGTR